MDLHRTVLTLLEGNPKLRCHVNHLVVAVWVQHDGLGTRVREFGACTSVEAIAREARRVWERRPDLSPTANVLSEPDLFSELQKRFTLTPTAPPGVGGAVDASAHAPTASLLG